MTMPDDQTAAAAESTQAGPTGLSPQGRAYGLDPDEQRPMSWGELAERLAPQHRSWGVVWRRAAVILSVGVGVAAAVVISVIVGSIYPHNGPSEGGATTAPAASPSPPTVTTPSDPDAQGQPSDQEFLRRMRTDYGYDITDATPYLRYAHEVCRLLGERESSVQVNDLLTQQIGQRMAIRVAVEAVSSYPHCETLVGN